MRKNCNCLHHLLKGFSRFRNLLPDLCSLLRSKVFPHSPFSDHDSDGSTARASSPTEESQPKPKAVSRAPSQGINAQSDARALARARSRSLSVSLAQEREQSAAAPTRKRMGTREVSMSRIFKPKPKPVGPPTSDKTEPESQSSQSQPKARDLGVTLVEETPAKPRDRTVSFSQTTLPSSRSLFGRQDSTLSVATDNDDAWQITSSPGIMLLASPDKADDDGDVDMAHTPATPSRPSRRKGRGRGGRR